MQMSKSDNKKKDNNKEQNKTTIIVVAISAVIIVALVAVIIVLLGKKQGGNEDEKPARNIVVTKDNAEKAVDEMVMTPYVEPGYFTVSMTNEWHFADASAISEDAFVENLEENTNDVYFDVFLASDESNPILESPVLPRGARLDNISLDKALEPGTYDCVMVYHLVDDKQNSISTLRVAITVIIEN